MVEREQTRSRYRSSFSCSGLILQYDLAWIAMFGAVAVWYRGGFMGFEKGFRVQYLGLYVVGIWDDVATT